MYQHISPKHNVIALLCPGHCIDIYETTCPGLFRCPWVVLATITSQSAPCKSLGHEPRDVSMEKCGYDIESPSKTGKLRFIEVKGRIQGARDVIVTKNEILTALNKPEDFILAIVFVDGERTETYYISQPFHKEPDFATTSVTYDLAKLLSKGSCLTFGS